MNVLVACEESQAVCLAFRRLGHKAFSCDLQECSGGHPEYHFKGNMFDVIANRGGTLENGTKHFLDSCWVKNQMEKEHHIYYIAYEECEPAGYVSIQQEDTDLFHLQKIYVLPYFQKYKLGRQLFQQAIKGIKELHPEPCRMELNVNRQNPALGFYEHMGMKKVREGDFPIGNGYYMNDYIMGMDI